MVQIFEVQFSPLLLPPPCGLIKPLSHLTCGQELTLTSLVALTLPFPSPHCTQNGFTHAHTHTHTCARPLPSSLLFLASVTFLRENPVTYIVSRQFKICFTACLTTFSLSSLLPFPSLLRSDLSQVLLHCANFFMHLP